MYWVTSPSQGQKGQDIDQSKVTLISVDHAWVSKFPILLIKFGCFYVFTLIPRILTRTLKPCGHLGVISRVKN